MHFNSKDKTLERNYLSKWRFLIKDYELIKKKEHPKYKFASEFYKCHGINRQIFAKYYNRYKQSGDILDTLPQKRGCKWKLRRLPYIDNKIIEQRKNGLNRYEIHSALSPVLKRHLPSPSTIYRICKKHGLGSLNKKMKDNKRRIIKEKAGELGHIDCHYLNPEIINGEKKKRYLVCVIDSCTRIAWAEVVDDIKSLTVMFTALKCFNAIQKQYGIQFEEILSDNGPEFASKNNLNQHPFERMLIEMDVKHRYTRPYRPQTNGKVERFWRTLNEDMIEGTDFDSVEELKKELFDYMIYYNEFRPHSAIGGLSPKKFSEKILSSK